MAYARRSIISKMTNKTTVHPLQTPEWAEFRKEWGNEVAKIESGYLTLHNIPLIGKIAIFEKGPTPTKEMMRKLRDFAATNNLVFIKLEPNIKKSGKLITLLKDSGAIPGKTLFTPTTFWIDLTKSEEDILRGFSSKTRYNIRLAERKGVTVTEDNSDQAFEKYLKLQKETVTRDKFYAHNEKYHRLMWKHLKGHIAHLLVAKYQGEIITAWIVFAHDGFLYYPYGASTHKYKQVMANNLMMWEAIKFGKKLNLKTFDLWGRELGKGFTKFKEGYNPQVIEFIGTWDLVIDQPRYYLYRLAESFRWLILHTKTNLGLAKYDF